MLIKLKGIGDDAEHVYRHCSEDSLRLLSSTVILGGRYSCHLHFTEREIETKEIHSRIPVLVSLTRAPEPGNLVLPPAIWKERGGRAGQRTCPTCLHLMLSGKQHFPGELGGGDPR